MKKEDRLFDRMLGALVGVAVGDALGGPLEFMSAEDIRKKHGTVRDMIGGGWLNLEPGEVTDDTQMTMAVARGIIKDPLDPVPEIGKNFILWFESRPKDVGNTCASAINTANQNCAEGAADWYHAARAVNLLLGGNTDGNGALMRTIYPAIYYHNQGCREEKVRNIAQMTHMGEMSTIICVEYANAVRAALFGATPYGFISKWHYREGAPPTGYVVDSWSNTIEAVLGTNSFEDAVIEAVNRGGDADTIGAITGGLAGAIYGYQAIPQRWKDAMDREMLDEMTTLAVNAYKIAKDQMVKV